MSLNQRLEPRLDEAQRLADWSRERIIHGETALSARMEIARRLGAHIEGDVVTFGFWTPELLDHRVPDGDVFLEVLAPIDELDLTISRATMAFQRARIPVARQDHYTFAAVTGAHVGTRVSV